MAESNAMVGKLISRLARDHDLDDQALVRLQETCVRVASRMPLGGKPADDILCTVAGMERSWRGIGMALASASLEIETEGGERDAKAIEQDMHSLCTAVLIDQGAKGWNKIMCSVGDAEKHLRDARRSINAAEACLGDAKISWRAGERSAQAGSPGAEAVVSETGHSSVPILSLRELSPPPSPPVPAPHRRVSTSGAGLINLPMASTPMGFITSPNFDPAVTTPAGGLASIASERSSHGGRAGSGSLPLKLRHKNIPSPDSAATTAGADTACTHHMAWASTPTVATPHYPSNPPSSNGVVHVLVHSGSDDSPPLLDAPPHKVGFKRKPRGSPAAGGGGRSAKRGRPKGTGKRSGRRGGGDGVGQYPGGLGRGKRICPTCQTCIACASATCAHCGHVFRVRKSTDPPSRSAGADDSPTGAGAEDAAGASTAPLAAAPSPQFEPGTIKHAAHRVLSGAGPDGLSVADVVSRTQELGYHDWGASRTPQNSVVAALSQDPHFVRVRPSTYALRAEAAAAAADHVEGGAYSYGGSPCGGDESPMAALALAAAAEELSQGAEDDDGAEGDDDTCMEEDGAAETPEGSASMASAGEGGEQSDGGSSPAVAARRQQAAGGPEEVREVRYPAAPLAVDLASIAAAAAAAEAPSMMTAEASEAAARAGSCSAGEEAEVDSPFSKHGEPSIFRPQQQ